MPHSSGGGSHGGGAHFSSSHSSSGGQSMPKISRRPYAGARRFVYYYPRTGRYVNLYYEGTPSKKSSRRMLIPLVGLVLMACMVLAVVLPSIFFVPRKTDLSSYDARIYVEDSLGVVADTKPLRAALEAFQTQTGVSPSVEIVPESAWEPYYTDLETFAYSEYLRLFDDEKHWLFVLSLPENPATAQFVDWQWEGMIGDAVGNTISTSSEETFTELLQTQLLRMEATEVDQALIAAFAAYGEVVMEPSHDFSLLYGLVPAIIVWAMMFWSVWSSYRGQKKLEQAIPVQHDAQDAVCEYCGCRYVVGTISVCPHCGAPIPAAAGA